MKILEKPQLLALTPFTTLMSENRLMPNKILFQMSHTLSQEETMLPTVVTKLKVW
jgi:hypothetical protein